MALTRSILAALILSAVVGVQPTGAATALAALTIQLSDLRPGYALVSAHYRAAATIAAAAQLSVQQLRGRGWVAGYQALYHRQQQPAVEVGDYVDRFRGASGAQWWYGISLRYVPSSYHTIRLPAVGEQFTALESGSGAPRSGFVAIIFRRGPYVADVYVSLGAVSPLSAAVALARLVDLRMQREIPAASAPRLSTAPSAFLLRAWVSPNPMPYRAYPTLFARTIPGAGCSASVSYVSGQPATSFNGYVQIAGQSGSVTWSWHEETREGGGTAHVTCTFQGMLRSAQATFHIAR